MDFDQAVEVALDGDAVLFTGAGFSLGATNLRGQPVKSASGFAEHLAGLVGISSESGLEDISEEYVAKAGVNSLIAELRSEFTAKAVCPYHALIAELPWRRIYTTNYDDVIELSRKGVGLHSLTLSDAIPRPEKGTILGVHLNGFVGHLSQDTATSEVKLTEGSYLAQSIADSHWGVAFRQDIAAARAVFFVGYSLFDLDIKRLLLPDDTLKHKAFFVLGKTPSEASLRRADRFGSALSIDTADFAAAVAERKANYSPKERHVVVGSSFRGRSVPKTGGAPSDRDIVDLLLDGRLRAELVWSSLHGGGNYVLERQQVGQVMSSFEAGTRAVVLHSSLGNGKTTVAETVVLRALEQGYSVYELRKDSSRIIDEVQQILENERRPLFVVEDYPDYLDVLRYILQQGGPDVRLLLSARSAVHDWTVDKLFDLAPSDSIVEVQVDRVDSAEAKWLAHWLDEFGLWGDMAAKSDADKQAFIERRCGGEIHGVLVRALEAPQMVTRYGALLDKLNRKRAYHEVALTALILNVVQFPPTPNVLADLCGEAVFESQFRRDAVIEQLLDFERGDIRFRSAVASQFILQRVEEPATVVDVLVNLARKADIAAGASPYYERLLKELVRFGRIQHVMPESQRRPALLKYYEGIKNLERCRNHPLFWLQYAIACLTIGELARAGKYFDTAYALAADQHYDTFQIDNHYARYVLASAALSRNAEDAMVALREARKIIERQIIHERAHYPYRAATAYYDVFAAVRSSLKEAELSEFAKAAQFVLDRIDLLSPFRQRQRYVLDSRKAMKKLIAEAIESGMRAH